MSDQNTKTLYHPDLPDHSREVPTKDAAEWQKAGWRATPRSEDKATDAPSEAKVDAKKG